MSKEPKQKAAPKASLKNKVGEKREAPKAGSLKATSKTTKAKKKSSNVKNKPATLMLDFSDNSLLADLYGEHNIHLARLEQKLSVELVPKGNYINVKGKTGGCEAVSIILGQMYSRLEAGQVITMEDVDGFIRMVDIFDPPLVSEAIATAPNLSQPNLSTSAIRTRKTVIQPRSVNQGKYMDALHHENMVFGLGPAGTGKTFLAVAMAVSFLLEGKVDRIILSRPAVEAGEKLGFLPGDMKDKVDPYLRPLYDALHHMMSAEQAEKRIETGDIEVAPLAFMRGRTLSNAFVILDEAQNTTAMQMKMFLTRFGENCHMVICGDPSQVDLPRGEVSGLRDAVNILSHIEDIAFIKFDADDVVRHQLVGKIVKAYDRQS
jgi:phosphate starvation-inducible PhoH-like protein